jgi:hypothetical protein
MRRRINAGAFRRGYDPRRHEFTAEERRRGYQSALEAAVAAGWDRYAWFYYRVRGYYRARRREALCV